MQKDKCKISEVISSIKWLLHEAERHSQDAAMGYDVGWYNGECNAYEIVLEKLEQVMKG